MAKKITPDPPASRDVLSTSDKDRYLRQPTNDESTPVPAQLLDTLAFTTCKPVTPQRLTSPRYLPSNQASPPTTP